MKLRYLDTGVKLLNEKFDASQVNNAGYYASSLYLGNFEELYETKEISKIRLQIYDNLPEKSEIPEPLPEKLKGIENIRKRIKENTYFYRNYTEKMDYLAMIHVHFDFDKWFKSNNSEKKKQIVNEIHKAVLQVVEHFAWDKTPFENAFKRCEEKKFENEWFDKRLKTKTSPNRKHKASIWVEFDLSEIRVFAHIVNQDGKLLKKELFYTLDANDENKLYPEDVNEVLKGKTKWEKEDFILFDKSGTEIARTSVNPMVQYKIDNFPLSQVAESEGKY